MWWLSSVVYVGFVALCFFILSTAFAVQLYVGEYAAALYGLFVTLPVSVASALFLYFVGRWLFEQFMS